MTATEPTASTESDVIISRPPRSPGQDAMRAFFRTKSAIAGMVILLILVLTAVFAPAIAPYEPTQVLIGKEPVKKRQTAEKIAHQIPWRL